MRLSSSVPLFLWAALLSVAAGTMVLLATREGIGMNNDSIEYIQSSQNLCKGRGLTIQYHDGTLVPARRFLPLYPAMLAGLELSGFSASTSARLINAAALATTVLLTFAFMFGVTEGSVPAASAAAVLSAFSVDILRMHLIAWVDPMVIALGFLSLYLLTLYLEQSRTILLLTSMATLATVLTLTHKGTAFYAAAVWMLLRPGRPAQEGRRDEVFLLICVWAPRCWLADFQTEQRLLGSIWTGFHSWLSDRFETLSSWFLPRLVPTELRLLVLFATVGWGIRVWGSLETRPHRPVEGRRAPVPGALRVLTSFALIYGAGLLVVNAALGEGIPFDQRALGPLFLPGVAWVAWLDRASASARTLPFLLRHFASVVCLLILILGAPRTLSLVEHARSEGLELYGTKQWKSSSMAIFLKRLPHDRLIYTTDQRPPYVTSGISSVMVPFLRDPDTKLANPEFELQVRIMAETLRARNGFLIFFNPPGTPRLDTATPYRRYLPSIDDIRRIVPLDVVISSPYGTVYRLATGKVKKTD